MDKQTIIKEFHKLFEESPGMSRRKAVKLLAKRFDVDDNYIRSIV
tara:strand:- start:146 stop:280 length:135 start_codon:yes stop_codon:yes gene_type:complete